MIYSQTWHDRIHVIMHTSCTINNKFNIQSGHIAILHYLRNAKLISSFYTDTHTDTTFMLCNYNQTFILATIKTTKNYNNKPKTMRINNGNIIMKVICNNRNFVTEKEDYTD